MSKAKRKPRAKPRATSRAGLPAVIPTGRGSLRPRGYRRNVVALSSFYDSSARSGGNGRFAFTAAQSRRSMETLETSSGSADVDLSWNLQEIRDRSSALIRNNGLAAGAIRTMVDNVVGRGLSFQSRVDYEYLGLTREAAAAWQTKAERLFAWWCKSKACDATGRLTFGAMQRLAYRSRLERGDVFAMRVKRPAGDVGPGTFALQLVEADRVANPVGIIEGRPTDGGGYITQGVEVGPTGAPVAYMVSKQHPGGFLIGIPSEFARIPARGASSGEWLVLHIGNQDRVDQARGIPLLSVVIEDFHSIKELGRITLQREAVATLFTAFVNTPGGQGLGDEVSTDADSSHPEDYRMGPGAILDLAPEESVTFADPKGVPSSFEMFLNTILSQDGPAIGMPFEILTKRFQSSYSAARGARLEYWKTVLVNRTEHIEQLCEPIKDAFLSDCVASGDLEAPGFFEDPLIRAAYLGSEWTGDVQGELDPLKSVQAAAARVALGISNLHRETIMETGEDFDTIYATRVEEVAQMKRDGMDVEAVAERIRTEPMAPEDPDQADEDEAAGREPAALAPEPPKRKRRPKGPRA